METGYDILFFWVARMIMMGLEFTGTVPFRTVYLHGLIRDERGRKMSKTLGNFIDPLDVIQEFGTDALRFTLLTSSTPGNDINVSLQRVEANRNFANKLWNASRLVLSAIGRAPASPGHPPDPTLADRWILARLAALRRDVTRLFESYQYGEAGRQIYEFFWGEFADWYLEVAKLQLDEGPDRAWLTARTMVHVLDTSLRLLHPFTPFVTEELWGHVKSACQAHAAEFGPEGGWEMALIVAAWPEAVEEAPGEAEALRDFALVMDLVRGIRNVRSERSVEPSRRIEAILSAGNRRALFESQRQAIAALARLDPDRMRIYATLKTRPQDAVPLVAGGIEAYLPLSGMVDIDAERSRLTRELGEVEAQIQRLEGLLAGPFAERAPAEVVAKERAGLEGMQQSRLKLEAQLKSLG